MPVAELNSYDWHFSRLPQQPLRQAGPLSLSVSQAECADRQAHTSATSTVLASEYCRTLLQRGVLPGLPVVPVVPSLDSVAGLCGSAIHLGRLVGLQ